MWRCHLFPSRQCRLPLVPRQAASWIRQCTACNTYYALLRRRPTWSPLTSGRSSKCASHLLHRPTQSTSLDTKRHILVVAALNLPVERERHPLTVVEVAADATTSDCPPIPPTAHCQHVAGGMVLPTAKGRPIVQAMELANRRALLHELQPPMLLAILAQTDLVLGDVEGYVLHGSVLL